MANRGNGVKLTSHEFGHNLTMNHARTRDFGADALGPLGSAGNSGGVWRSFLNNGLLEFRLLSCPACCTTTELAFADDKLFAG
jgi:hypothetical protein